MVHRSGKFILRYIMDIRAQRLLEAPMQDKVAEYLSSIINDSFQNYNAQAIELSHTGQHYHIYFLGSPSTVLIKMITNFKSVTSRKINKLFGFSGQFWSNEYSIYTLDSLEKRETNAIIQSAADHIKALDELEREKK